MTLQRARKPWNAISRPTASCNRWAASGQCAKVLTTSAIMMRCASRERKPGMTLAMAANLSRISCWVFSESMNQAYRFGQDMVEKTLRILDGA
jgi:hypothetical protein